MMRSDPPAVHQPERVIVGNCPDCGRVIVVLNNREVWPFIECECGARLQTTDIVQSHRVERTQGWQVISEPTREQEPS
jgi:endogenous inhibitor of DNA gyrase (YacG/DUF329 family)